MWTNRAFFDPRPAVRAAGLALGFSVTAHAAALVNPDFESGDLSGWTVEGGDLSVEASSLHSFNRDYSAHVSGIAPIGRETSLQLVQTVMAMPGDLLVLEGWDWSDDLAPGSAAAFLIPRLENTNLVQRVERSRYLQPRWRRFEYEARVSPSAPGPQAIRVVLRVAAEAFPDDLPGRVSLFVDALTLKGSSVNPPLDGIRDELLQKAATLASSPQPLPAWTPPSRLAHGFAGADGKPTNLPSRVEIGFTGYNFRHLTNTTPRVVELWLELYQFEGNAPVRLDLDQLRYVASNPHQPRDAPPVVKADEDPYFTLGNSDGSSAEFGPGLGGEEMIYTVGEPLDRLPRRLVSDGAGGYPRRLRIRFQERFSSFDAALWHKHLVLHTVPGDASGGLKKVIATFRVLGDEPRWKDVPVEVHLGWAAEAWGRVFYPNVTFGDHNLGGSLRMPWANNLVDDHQTWYMQQEPAGNGTPEPIDLHAPDERGGGWVQRMYEEYLFQWSLAGSGVRSLFDPDTRLRLPGPVSYHVGLKVGHKYGRDDTGRNDSYPQVMAWRGNGYGRSTDYGGVLAGSFRPVAHDLFGLHQGAEDAPLAPTAHARVVPEDPGAGASSFGRVDLFLRSKTNQFLVGAVRMDLHFHPNEAFNGTYMDLSTDVFLRRALDPSVHGALCGFSQVNLCWANHPGFNQAKDVHDVDTLMLERVDGEWISHSIRNPRRHIRRTAWGRVRQGDRLHLQQQDRAALSYGALPDSPYTHASDAEITLLDSGGLPLELACYEQHTNTEANDNIVTAFEFPRAFAAGTRVATRWRYLNRFAPGVRIEEPASPAVPPGPARIRFRVTHPEGPLHASVWYGSGRAGEWNAITTAPLAVPGDGTPMEVDWDTSAVPAGAYYLRVEAWLASAPVKQGFDVSDQRWQIGGRVDLAGQPVGAPPALDAQGLALFQPGEAVEHVLLVRNASATPLAGARLQVIPESAELRQWEEYHYPRGPEHPELLHVHEAVRPGDRFAPSCETWHDLPTLAPGAGVAVTNRFVLPEGIWIDQARLAIQYEDSFRVGRVPACRARLRLVVRDALGRGVQESASAVSEFSVDDDFDLDDDGLPDDWEVAHFGDRVAGEPGADPDLDGLNNQAEALAGSNPLDASSGLAVSWAPTPQGGELVWRSQPGRWYRVQQSRSLASPQVWTSVDTLVATGLETRWAVPPGGNQASYRIAVIRPAE